MARLRLRHRPWLRLRSGPGTGSGTGPGSGTGFARPGLSPLTPSAAPHPETPVSKLPVSLHSMAV